MRSCYEALPASGCESDRNPTGWRLQALRLNTQCFSPTANRVRPKTGHWARLASRGRSQPRGRRWVTGALLALGWSEVSLSSLSENPTNSASGARLCEIHQMGNLLDSNMHTAQRHKLFEYSHFIERSLIWTFSNDMITWRMAGVFSCPEQLNRWPCPSLWPN